MYIYRTEQFTFLACIFNSPLQWSIKPFWTHCVSVWSCMSSVICKITINFVHYHWDYLTQYMWNITGYHMCVCMYIYIYIYTHTHIHTYTTSKQFIYIYIYIDEPNSLWMYTHTHTHTLFPNSLYIYIYINCLEVVCVCVCVYIHTELGSSDLRMGPGLQRGPGLRSVCNL